MDAKKLTALLRCQAQDIAGANHNGWGNTMNAAADEIERLRIIVLTRDQMIENLQRKLKEPETQKAPPPREG
jgi:quinolinate synthase